MFCSARERNPGVGRRRDRRVVRGNTYAAQVLPAAALQDERTTSPGSPGRAPSFTSGRRGRGERLGTGQSDVVQGPVVECLLEEITDRPIEIMEAITTEKVRFDDRPPSPIFVPQPRGIDVGTQVGDNDLFDFDVEVEPILQIIVGSTLEKSLAEVIEEMDLEEELQAREVFELVRISERLECQRVELKDVRQQEERERRQMQNVSREEAAKLNVKRSAASSLAHTYVGDVVSEVFNNLEGAGFFFDPLIRYARLPMTPMIAAFANALWCGACAHRGGCCSLRGREIEDTFLPWLEAGVHANIKMAQATQDNVTHIAAAAVALQEKRRNDAAAEYQAMLAAIAKAEADRLAEQARLLQEAEAAAAVAQEEARLAAEAAAGTEGQGSAD